MSVGASQKCGWGRAKITKGKCGIQPEVWLGKVESKESVAANRKCG